MRRLIGVVSAAACGAVLFNLSPTSAQPSLAPAAADVDAAPFVFVGTLTSPGASNVKLVAASSQTALVRVDEIIKGPPSMAGLVEHQLTLVAPVGMAPRPGQAVYFVRPFLYAEAVAAQLVAIYPASEAPNLRKLVISEAARLGEEKLSSRLAAAALVVEARVEAVEPVKGARIGSEHDPDLYRASLRVVRPLSGKWQGPLEVYFANSTDERWYRSPKLRAGETAVFLLQRGELGELPPPARSAAARGFTVLDEGDVRPLEDAARVQRLLATVK